ncbi:MAG: oligoendopeptidase F [candidate division Zixibacteria bacterium]|nr:oligoendopeptidase F [candidate division Zixibacteria bacterium]NIR64745.1 oligoendopeptidase F [candidate division Zixibacteria bacterium]NIS17188.1 oligoendopeptidase F [candidate division Zixibacteria bacterium]NIS46575.1 oligoendopeptidase F [candidate division Zixibacteria bacterium]NIT53541.1 oligoendopeptidase F [candidate division Zixibacteria bacterium]
MTPADSKTIPQRSDIEDKYKWNLTDLYESDAEWEKDYKKAQEMLTKAKGFTDRLADSPAILFDCLTLRSDVSLICDNLHFYAKRNADLDHRVSKYQSMTDRAAMLISQAGAAFSFVEPELLQIDDKQLKEMAEHFPERTLYDFYIKELIRSREHIRSAEIEELLAQSILMARGPSSVFTMLNDADMKYPSIKDKDGREVRITKQRYAKFMESPVQRVRRDAHESLFSSYKEHINTIGASLSASINTDVFYSRARRYESSLHQALDAINVPVEVYHSLLDTTEKNLEGLHKWIELRRKILKLDKIYPYDLVCPLFPEENYEVSYEDAVKEVTQAVESLGKDYTSNLKKAFESNWVDVYETEGKASGAYSSSNYSSHPVVLMNYNDTIDNMFTLAHEMGHCLHSFYSNKMQPYPKAQYTIFVAEVASTLNEGLLLQHLLKKVTDDKKKLFLLNQHIDNTFGTYFNQVMYARFELMIHEEVERGGALSPDRLNEIWNELTKKYYGPALSIDDYIKYKWARIPHFYYTYYVYQYSTSYAASQAILEKFLKGEEGIVEKYLQLLSSGGSDYPINQLKTCGVDMTTAAPFEATIKLFEEQVNEVERLGL